ncbi:aldehyde dehydrogenase family protein [Hahella aquimaris]|uniref:L-piperidine-6-carboxylate dehydrogenase n=1 Tax=Hahella sp. HNIBRBA332 TaxID=3015983 RepID=UPI00273B720A|nr:aldehyde dehydrogenase family protein [Hahella sp. HNIBRBA332]WLQ11774.1 aldehyde dehydrogenase family protein [Hahella sp. HNIBRBA332]
MNIQEIFSALDMDQGILASGDYKISSPVDGKVIANLKLDSKDEVEKKIAASADAFKAWRRLPAPQRGELVRIYGEELRKHKETLGALITLECGKIISEGQGEVQEMIDICDFAVGLSRQLYGLTIASERPNHALRESWHPMGPVGVISAFNFPMAVWAWNSALALVCGDPVIWKPSEKTPLCALACQHLLDKAIARFGEAPEGLSSVIIGEREVGEQLVDDKRVPLISATGSCAMGRVVGQRVAARFGKSILELGGNNAIIVAESADLDMATRAIVFGAVGTAGQRCTTTRRIFAHDSIYDELLSRLKAAYKQLPIGNPQEAGTLIGPLIDGRSYEQMEQALADAKAKGCDVYGGGRALEKEFPQAYYVNPAIVEGGKALTNNAHETFAPILYFFRYSDLEEAIERQNDVPQGLSSAIFTLNMREAELFTSAVGSDCGIANVNVGTSGAEIGGAFGGEKETGGGRESGSDSWKAYMRRSTATVNYSSELPLAQGIKFDLN